MSATEIKQLTEAVQRLTERVEELEAKVSPKPYQKPAVSPETRSRSFEKGTGPVQELPLSAPRIQPPPPAAQSGRWLGIVSVICFLLAASYFIRLAIESGWLTPERQLGGVFLLGIVLICGGFQFKTRDLPYAGFLPAAGIAILYMGVFAGHLYYRVFAEDTAVILAGVVSFLSIYLFTAFNHDFFVITAIASSYLVPFFVRAFIGELSGLMMYFLFWDITFCGLAVLLKKRSVIAFVSYFAIGLFHVLAGSQRDAAGGLAAMAAFQALQFAILAGAGGGFSAWAKSAMTAGEAWFLFPPLLLFYSVEYFLVDRLYPGYAPWAALAFAAVVAAIYFAVCKHLNRKQLESLPMVAAFGALVVFHAVYLNILPAALCPWLAVLIMFGLPLLHSQIENPSRFWVANFIMYWIVVLEYCRSLSDRVVLSGMFQDMPVSGQIVINFIFAGAIFAAYRLNRGRGGFAGDFPLITLMLAIVQAMFGLQRLVGLGFYGQTEMFVVSVTWGCLALALLLLAKGDGDKMQAKSALIIFGIVAGKVLFRDIASGSSMVRVISLVVIGALLYFGGYLVRQIETWQPKKKKAR